MRTRKLEQIKQENWDIIIVGGGITGAGILREAANSGLKVLLVEQKDFSWGTSSRSTKMIHGGLRYLKSGDVILTYKSVRERENLLNELPGLAKNNAFILPVYKGKRFQKWLIHIGLIIYNILAWKWRKNIFPKKELLKLTPSIKQNGFQAGFLVNDGVTDDARLVLRVLDEAIDKGATAINYCKVTKLLKSNNNKVNGVNLKDMETSESFDLKSKLVINATGAWVDNLRSEIKKSNSLKIRPLRGSHLILSKDRIPLKHNFLTMHPKDNRPVTILLWEGRILLGTTDKDHKNNMNEEASITKEEIDYLLEAINNIFPKLEIKKNDIIATISGVRPVVDSGKKDPSKESRDYAIWKEDGLLTVTGGKLTTFRITALDALKQAKKYIGELSNIEKNKNIFSDYDKTIIKSILKKEQVIRLQGRYGRHFSEIIKNAQDNELKLIPNTNTIWAELRYAAKNESIVHLDDLMLRRTRIGLLLNNGGSDILSKVKKICQPLLGWNDEKWQKEVDRYLEIWKKYYSF